jgi:hypothetical protein
MVGRPAVALEARLCRPAIARHETRARRRTRPWDGLRTSRRVLSYVAPPTHRAARGDVRAPRTPSACLCRGDRGPGESGSQCNSPRRVRWPAPPRAARERGRAAPCSLRSRPQGQPRPRGKPRSADAPSPPMQSLVVRADPLRVASYRMRHRVGAQDLGIVFITAQSTRRDRIHCYSAVGTSSSAVHPLFLHSVQCYLIAMPFPAGRLRYQSGNTTPPPTA